MSVTELPRDTRGFGIPVLRPAIAGAQTVAVTNTTNRNSTAFKADTKIISIYSTQDVHIEIGTSAVEATTSDHFIPASTYMLFSVMVGIVPFTHIAAIRATADGTLYISEFQ